MRASGCTDLTAMGIESFFVCSLLILLGLGKSEQPKIAVKSSILQHDVRSIAREVSVAPATTFKPTIQDLLGHGMLFQKMWCDFKSKTPRRQRVAAR
jgi:hypothetical protein